MTSSDHLSHSIEHTDGLCGFSLNEAAGSEARSHEGNGKIKRLRSLSIGL
jgi:hypothetical protein